MTLRSGIPLNEIATAITLREAAQRVIDETTVQDSVYGGSVAIVPYGAIEDLENILATPEPALSDGLLHDVLLNLFADSKYGECPDPVGDIIDTLRRYGFVITRIGGA